MASLAYPLLGALLGLVIGWAPILFHGPIPEKFDLYRIHGAVAVWAYYLARLSIGFWVEVSTWPERWWLHGPLCGFVAMLPVTCFSLAVPSCGPMCMSWNLVTASIAGALVAGIAFALTGRQRA